jgi:hypothetical protein
MSPPKRDGRPLAEKPGVFSSLGVDGAITTSERSDVVKQTNPAATRPPVLRRIT